MTLLTNTSVDPGYTEAKSLSIYESGFAVSDFGNEQLTWEKADQFDVGLDMGFFDDRLTFIVD
ncbi:MAG: TonB-dependent receptor, partial [Clostridiales bacterium]|nr:TonB-dependent receptor [Clostridiales bacterium]